MESSEQLNSTNYFSSENLSNANSFINIQNRKSEASRFQSRIRTSQNYKRFQNTHMQPRPESFQIFNQNNFKSPQFNPVFQSSNNQIFPQNDFFLKQTHAQNNLTNLNSEQISIQNEDVVPYEPIKIDCAQINLDPEEQKAYEKIKKFKKLDFELLNLEINDKMMNKYKQSQGDASVDIQKDNNLVLIEPFENSPNLTEEALQQHFNNMRINVLKKQNEQIQQENYQDQQFFKIKNQKKQQIMNTSSNSYFRKNKNMHQRFQENRAAKIQKSLQFENSNKQKTDQFISKNIVIKDEQQNLQFEDIKQLGKIQIDFDDLQQEDCNISQYSSNKIEKFENIKNSLSKILEKNNFTENSESRKKILPEEINETIMFIKQNLTQQDNQNENKRNTILYKQIQSKQLELNIQNIQKSKNKNISVQGSQKSQNDSEKNKKQVNISKSFQNELNTAKTSPMKRVQSVLLLSMKQSAINNQSNKNSVLSVSDEQNHQLNATLIQQKLKNRKLKKKFEKSQNFDQDKTQSLFLNSQSRNIKFPETIMESRRFSEVEYKQVELKVENIRHKRQSFNEPFLKKSNEILIFSKSQNIFEKTQNVYERLFYDNEKSLTCIKMQRIPSPTTMKIQRILKETYGFQKRQKSHPISIQNQDLAYEARQQAKQNTKIQRKQRFISVHLKNMELECRRVQNEIKLRLKKDSSVINSLDIKFDLQMSFNFKKLLFGYDVGIHQILKPILKPKDIIQHLKFNSQTIKRRSFSSDFQQFSTLKNFYYDGQTEDKVNKIDIINVKKKSQKLSTKNLKNQNQNIESILSVRKIKKFERSKENLTQKQIEETKTQEPCISEKNSESKIKKFYNFNILDNQQSQIQDLSLGIQKQQQKQKKLEKLFKGVNQKLLNEPLDPVYENEKSMIQTNDDQLDEQNKESYFPSTCKKNLRQIENISKSNSQNDDNPLIANVQKEFEETVKKYFMTERFVENQLNQKSIKYGSTKQIQQLSQISNSQGFNLVQNQDKIKTSKNKDIEEELDKNTLKGEEKKEEQEQSNQALCQLTLIKQNSNDTSFSHQQLMNRNKYQNSPVYSFDSKVQAQKEAFNILGDDFVDFQNSLQDNMNIKIIANQQVSTQPTLILNQDLQILQPDYQDKQLTNQNLNLEINIDQLINYEAFMKQQNKSIFQQKLKDKNLLKGVPKCLQKKETYKKCLQNPILLLKEFQIQKIKNYIYTGNNNIKQHESNKNILGNIPLSEFYKISDYQLKDKKVEAQLLTNEFENLYNLKDFEDYKNMQNCFKEIYNQQYQIKNNQTLNSDLNKQKTKEIKNQQAQTKINLKNIEDELFGEMEKQQNNLKSTQNSSIIQGNTSGNNILTASMQTPALSSVMSRIASPLISVQNYRKSSYQRRLDREHLLINQEKLLFSGVQSQLAQNEDAQENQNENYFVLKSYKCQSNQNKNKKFNMKLNRSVSNFRRHRNTAQAIQNSNNEKKQFCITNSKQNKKLLQIVISENLEKPDFENDIENDLINSNELENIDTQNKDLTEDNLIKNEKLQKQQLQQNMEEQSQDVKKQQDGQSTCSNLQLQRIFSSFKDEIQIPQKKAVKVATSRSSRSIAKIASLTECITTKNLNTGQFMTKESAKVSKRQSIQINDKLKKQINFLQPNTQENIRLQFNIIKSEIYNRKEEPQNVKNKILVEDNHNLQEIFNSNVIFQKQRNYNQNKGPSTLIIDDFINRKSPQDIQIGHNSLEKYPFINQNNNVVINKIEEKLNVKILQLREAVKKLKEQKQMEAFELKNKLSNLHQLASPQKYLKGNQDRFQRIKNKQFQVGDAIMMYDNKVQALNSKKD